MIWGAGIEAAPGVKMLGVPKDGPYKSHHYRY
jgi:hypothetical protein